MAVPGVGSVVSGYRVLEILGRGGMGTVFKVQHPRLPRADALKLLDPLLSGDPQFRARFARESDLAAPLNHRNIVSVYDRGVSDGQLWCAMEYVSGTDAARLVQNGPAHPALAVRIITGAAAGLDYAHRRGLLHRDVKPANILVAPGHDPLVPEAVKLTDFGIARAADAASSLTADGQRLGTLRYCSPEQIEGRPLDNTADVYALGCTLHELLTGTAPFDSPTQQSLMYAHLTADPPRPSAGNPAVPTAMDRVIATAMAKRPADRYQSCGELAAAATAALSGTPRAESTIATSSARSLGYATNDVAAQTSWSAYGSPQPTASQLNQVHAGPPGATSNGPPTDWSTPPADPWYRRVPVVATLAIGIIAVVLAVILAVVLSASGGSSSSDSPAPAAANSQSQSAVHSRKLSGTWAGTYTCNQGSTGLTLTIGDAPDSGDGAPVTFAFGPTSADPAVPSGSYTMTVTGTGDGPFFFIQRDWVKQPAGYVMVDLTGHLTDPNTLTGTVQGTGCTEFTVTRHGSM